MSGAKDLAKPYLAGFDFSRPQQGRRYDSVSQNNIRLDWYHHPSKRLYPELRYLQAFDLYSYVQYSRLNL